MNRKSKNSLSRLFASVDWQAVNQIDWYLRWTSKKDQEKSGGSLYPPGKKQISNQFVFFSFGVDPFTWQSFVEIGEMECSTAARCYMPFFSDLFDNFYQQNSNLQLIWKCISTGGLHKHTILITVTVVEISKSNRAKHRMYTQCSCTIKRVFSCDNYMFPTFYLCEDFIQMTLTNLQQQSQLHVIYSKITPVG